MAAQRLMLNELLLPAQPIDLKLKVRQIGEQAMQLRAVSQGLWNSHSTSFAGDRPRTPCPNTTVLLARGWGSAAAEQRP